MTALELQQALAAMPSRAAGTLILRCVDDHSPEQCAGLYGIGQSQWEILYLEAARALVGQTTPLDDATRQRLAPRLVQGLQTPELEAVILGVQSLTQHREEVKRLITASEKAAESSPARRREPWIRGIAIVAIVAVSAVVWFRDPERLTEVLRVAMRLLHLAGG